MSLFSTKPLGTILADADKESLKRSLGAGQLIALGIGAIIGAGIYADDETGAAGATGLGEELWKACASFRTVEAMKRGLTPQEACEETILHMIRRQSHSTEHACVVFAMNKAGEYGAATTSGVFHLWICRDGEITVQEYNGINL